MQYAKLEWTGQDVPRSPQYDDVYFSTDDGPAESRYVFLEGNQFAKRWQGQNEFSIGELGFGTGLNFWLTWELWRKHPQAPQQLHYHAFEQHPLAPQHLHPSLQGLSWPLPLEGHFPLLLDEGRVVLHLHYGAADTRLSELKQNCDAWYLDGFAPAKNPSLWSRNLFQQLAQHTRPEGTFATYSAASQVRKTLDEVGFQVERRPGFGKKRECLRGRYCGPDHTSPTQPPRHVTIIGGGIAGCASAFAFAQRGAQVQLFERQAQLANAASGNPAGILLPYFTSTYEKKTRFYWEGFHYTQMLWRFLQAAGHDIPGDNCGLLWLGSQDRDIAKLPKVLSCLDLPLEELHWLDVTEASAQAGVPVTRGGLWLRRGSWLQPAALCRALVQHPNINVMTERNIESLPRSDENLVVLANAYEAQQLLDEDLNLSTVRGQLSSLMDHPMAAQLKVILNYGGYAFSHGTRLELGASFVRDYTDLEISEAEHQQICQGFREVVPTFSNVDTILGRVSERTVSRTRDPLLGPLPEQQNILLNLAHGSRGLLSAPWGAELMSNAANFI